MRDQKMLTAIGADYVCRQGEIRNRAIARCAGKVDQSMQPLAIKSTQSCFALNANCGGREIDHHAQANTRARCLVVKIYASTLRFPFYDPTILNNQMRAGKWYRYETINFQTVWKIANVALDLRRP